jgi:hypothetical protein
VTVSERRDSESDSRSPGGGPPAIAITVTSDMNLNPDTVTSSQVNSELSRPGPAGFKLSRAYGARAGPPGPQSVTVKVTRKSAAESES